VGRTLHQRSLQVRYERLFHIVDMVLGPSGLEAAAGLDLADAPRFPGNERRGLVGCGLRHLSSARGPAGNPRYPAARTCPVRLSPTDVWSNISCGCDPGIFPVGRRLEPELLAAGQPLRRTVDVRPDYGRMQRFP